MTRVQRSALMRLGILGFLLFAGFVLWQWTPMGQYLQPDRMAEWGQRFSGHPLAPLATVAVVVAGCVGMVPITWLMLAPLAMRSLPVLSMMATLGTV